MPIWFQGLVTCLFLLLPLTTAGANVIRTGGTGAVHRVMQMIAAEYEKAHPDDRVQIIPGLGSSGAIVAIQAGALELMVSSRELTEKERETGLRSQPLIDTPFVFAANIKGPLKLKKTDIPNIYGGLINRYDDGSALRLVLRPRKDSHNLFLIATYQGIEAMLEKARLRPDVPVAATDHENIESVQKISGGFSAFSFVQLKTEPNTLAVAEIDGVIPSVETLASGAYKETHRIRLILPRTVTAGAQRFLDFLGGPVAKAIFLQHGSIPLSAR